MNKQNILTPPHPKEKTFLLPSLQQQTKEPSSTFQQQTKSTFQHISHVVKLVPKKKKITHTPKCLSIQVRIWHKPNLSGVPGSSKSCMPCCSFIRSVGVGERESFSLTCTPVALSGLSPSPNVSLCKKGKEDTGLTSGQLQSSSN